MDASIVGEKDYLDDVLWDDLVKDDKQKIAWIFTVELKMELSYYTGWQGSSRWLLRTNMWKTTGKGSLRTTKKLRTIDHSMGVNK